MIAGIGAAAISATHLNVTLTAFISIVAVPMELPEEIAHGCNAISDGCPVTEGDARIFSTTVMVSSPLAPLEAYIQMAVFNELQQDFMCARAKIKLVK